MKQITITLDESGRCRVEADIDGQAMPAHECDSVDECLAEVGELLGKAPGNDEAEPAGEMDAEAMWNDEAGKRAQARQAQAAY